MIEEQAGFDLGDFGAGGEGIQRQVSKVGAVADGNMDEEILASGEMKDCKDLAQRHGVLPEILDVLATVLAQTHGDQGLKAYSHGFGRHPGMGGPENAFGAKPLNPGSATGGCQPNGRSQLFVG